MKIAVSSTTNNESAMVDERFGRCPFFAISDGAKLEFVENTGKPESHGAGLTAAQVVVDEGVEAVITGNVGPKAISILNKFQIKVYKASGSIKKAIKDFSEGKLTELKSQWG